MRKVIHSDVKLSVLNLTELFNLSDVEVSGDFYCSDNHLINLTGAPHIVHGNFICVESNLTSLAGGPLKVAGKFSCQKNNLTNLIGAPHIVGDSFFCHGNNLTSLEGIPKKIGGSFVILHTLQSRFSREYIHSLSEISGSVTYM